MFDIKPENLISKTDKLLYDQNVLLMSLLEEQRKTNVLLTPRPTAEGTAKKQQRRPKNVISKNKA